MGLADYSVIDNTGNPYPVDFRNKSRFSTMNQLIEGLDPTFTGIYCVEALIKIVAYGFISGPNTYLRDGWNILDFVAAVSSVAALVPNVPNVSSLRTLRVLRPLRSLKMLPGMKVIIDSMLMAIEPLANVVVLLIAVFVIFGILMTQLFMGVQHQRCRMTPFPVKLEVNTSVVCLCLLRRYDWCLLPLLLAFSSSFFSFFLFLFLFFFFFCSNIVSLTFFFFFFPLCFSSRPSLVLLSSFSLQNSSNLNYPASPEYLAQVYANPEAFRCIASPNTNPLEWNQKTSPWSTPKSCMWPVDTTDERICSQEKQFGNHRCDNINHKYCGSNYDSFGNPRFSSDRIMLLDDNYIPALNFGYTTVRGRILAFLFP